MIETFSTKKPERVKIAGKRNELQAFALFLKEKGNPHEEQGVAIDWDVER